MLFLWLERLRFDQIISYAPSNYSIGSKTLVNLGEGFLRPQYLFRLQIWDQSGDIKLNICFAALRLC